MKKVFSLLMVMAFVFAAIAQEAGEKHKKVKEPEITFENLTHDYGNIQQGDNGVCEFVFKNTGKADLILTNCRSSCGCTVPNYPKDPIKPGERGAIDVTYNGAGKFAGRFKKNITVRSNAKESSVVRLTIEGEMTTE